MSEELNLYKKVTAQDIFNVAKKYLNPHQMKHKHFIPFAQAQSQSRHNQSNR